MQAILYTKQDCQECDRARMLLNSLNISHLEYKLNSDFTEKQFKSEFGPSAFFPQIAIDYKHIGNLKETLQYFKDKKII